MSSLSVTFADLAGAIARAVKPLHREEVSCDGVIVGWLVETTLPRADMRFKWSACGSYGYCATRDECLVEAGRQFPRWREARRIEAVREAEIASLPEPLKSLRIEKDHRRVLLEVERRRNIIRPDDLARAEKAYDDAVMAYYAAERAMAEAA